MSKIQMSLVIAISLISLGTYANNHTYLLADSTGNPAISVYPNPTRNRAELGVKNFGSGDIQLQILDQNGTLKKEEKRMLLSGNEIVHLMFVLPKGVYYLLASQEKKIARTKMIIQ